MTNLANSANAQNCATTTTTTVQNLLSAIKKVKALKPCKSIPILADYFLLKDGYLVANNLSTEIQVPLNVDENFTFLLPKEVEKVLSSLKKGEVSILQTGEVIELSHEKGNFTFQVFDKLENWPNNFSETIADSTYNGTGKNINTFVQFASKDELRPAMCGVYADEGELVATDAHIIKRVKQSGFLEHGIIPSEAAKFMTGFTQLYSTHTQEKQGIARMEDGTIVKYRKEQNRYPDYKAVYPNFENYTKGFKIDRKELIEKLTFLVPFVNKVTNAITFDFKGNDITITAKDKDRGTNASQEVYDESRTGEDLQISFNAKFLLTTLKDCNLIKVNFQIESVNRCAIIENYLLMPVMLKY